MSVKKQYLAQSAILSAMLLTGACSGGGGGGGVNTTPAPTASPSPTPSTPTPGPAPTPSTNANLLGPLVSEDFANDASIGSATFSTSGGRGTAANATVSVAYNATNQSYTLNSASGSITFGPSDIDSGQSSAGAMVYIRRNGSGAADSLTVTRPGTSGPVTYTYVGSVFWQHTVINGTSGSGFMDAAAYGAKTPDSTLPRTGSANYAVDLIGAETLADNLAGISGSGATNVDFASGRMLTTGTMKSALGSGQTTFTSTARIDGATNHFSGDFTFEDFGYFTGTLSGRFYGPAAQEIGAAFATANADGRIAVGTIMGRQGAPDIGNASFAPPVDPRLLTNSQTFTTIAARDNFTLPGITGSNDKGAPSNASTRMEPLAIRYDAATNSYSLMGPDSAIALPPGRFDSIAGGSSNGVSLRNPSSEYPNAPATRYVMLGNWVTETVGTGVAYRNAFFAFGMPTTDADLVRTGAAGFKVSVQGQAADDAYPNVAKFSGRGDLYVDFAAGSVHGLVPLTITEDYFISGGHPTGRTRGDLTLDARLASNTNGFSGTATLSGLGNYAGTTQGQFFGPGAVEVGGAFSVQDGTSVAVGAFAGARDSTVTDPTATIPRLADLTSATDLSVVTASTASTYGDIVKINYDPAAKAYRVSFQDTHLSGAPVRTLAFDPSTENLASGNASYRSYTVNSGGPVVTAAILRPDNPQVALSYTSIGEFVAQSGSTPFDWVRFFAVSGIPTPRAPSSGTASYAGIARGAASVAIRSNASGAAQTTLYDLVGNATLSVNFATTEFTATLNALVGTPTAASDGTPTAGMPTRNFDPLVYNGNVNGATFDAYGNSTHGFSGRFYGPNAAEFGAYFNHDDFGTPGPGSVAVGIRGVAAGKRQ